MRARTLVVVLVAVLAVYPDADHAPSEELARSVTTVDRVGPTPRPDFPFEVGPTGFIHAL